RDVFEHEGAVGRWWRHPWLQQNPAGTLADAQHDETLCRLPPAVDDRPRDARDRLWAECDVDVADVGLTDRHRQRERGVRRIRIEDRRVAGRGASIADENRI